MKIGQVRQFALGLEAVTEAPHHHYSSFRVRGKIFVTVPPDEKHIHVFVAGEVQDQTVALHPEFTEKLFWGSKALGVRVHLADAPAAVVKNLIRLAYETRVAKDAGPPKRAKAPVKV